MPARRSHDGRPRDTNGRDRAADRARGAIGSDRTPRGRATTQDHDTLTVELDDDALAKKYGGALERSMTGPFHHLVARVFKNLTGKKVFAMGKFKTQDGRQAIGCSLRANSGYLYCLEVRTANDRSRRVAEERAITACCEGGVMDAFLNTN